MHTCEHWSVSVESNTHNVISSMHQFNPIHHAAHTTLSENPRAQTTYYSVTALRLHWNKCGIVVFLFLCLQPCFWMLLEKEEVAYLNHVVPVVTLNTAQTECIWVHGRGKWLASCPWGKCIQQAMQALVVWTEGRLFDCPLWSNVVVVIVSLYLCIPPWLSSCLGVAFVGYPVTVATVAAYLFVAVVWTT